MTVVIDDAKLEELDGELTEELTESLMGYWWWKCLVLMRSC